MLNTKLPIYGICLLTALFLNIVFVYILSKRKKYPNYIILSLLVLENVGILYGAKILAFFQKYGLSSGRKFNFFEVGVSAYGGLIGAIVVLVLFTFISKIPFKELIHIVLPPVPLVYAIGKIGCFLTGCCYGIKYNGIGHVVYKYSMLDNANMSLFPVQLVESIVFILIFAYILYRYKKYGDDSKNISILFILCSIAKFSLYYLRMEHINAFFSSGQILCVLFFLVGVVTYISSFRKKYG